MMTRNKQPAKRLNITFPQDLLGELQETADRHSTTVTALLRQSARLLLLAVQIEETPGSALLIEEGGAAREIKLIM